METLGQQVAKRIDEYLFRQKISLYALCKKSKIALSTLKNIYSKHTKSPSLELIYKICYGLNISIIEFFNSPLLKDTSVKHIILDQN